MSHYGNTGWANTCSRMNPFWTDKSLTTVLSRRTHGITTTHCMGFHVSGTNLFHNNINTRVDHVKRSFLALLPTSRDSIYLFDLSNCRSATILFITSGFLNRHTYFMLLPHIIFKLFIDMKNVYKCTYVISFEKSSHFM